MKKKELLERILYLEAKVRQMDDLQKVREESLRQALRHMQGLDTLNTLLYNNLERLNSEDDIIEVEIDTEAFRP